MNYSDLKKLSVEELAVELSNAELLSQDLRYNHSIASLQNTQELRLARKDIARIKTELRSRELSSDNNLQRDKILARRKKERK
jgi:large subunit ribosomal protein L29